MPFFEKTNQPVCLRIAKFRAAFLLIVIALGVDGFASEKLVNITNQKTSSGTVFFVQNLQAADVTVTIETKLSNYQATTALPCTLTIPAKTRTNVFTISRVDPKAEADWSYTYFATWGNLAVQHDDAHIYALPFASGEAFPVSQGFHGKYSHTGGDEFAIDFKMPEGTHVHAARDGVVVGVKDDSSKGGPDKKYEWDANYILIRHDDGTLGHYVHLQKGCARVKVGDTVKVGDWIGCSGNTGHTTGPHLHFAVFKAASGKNRQTIPVKFNTNGQLAQTLVEGSFYRAL
jgi:murein DD-endopeptidase MepM/ murein hydrolase activator NlpD